MSAEIVEVGPDAAASGAKLKSKKKLIIAGAAAAVLLLGGGGSAFLFLSGGNEAHAETGDGHEAAAASGDHGGDEGTDAYFDVPPIVVNLRSPDGQARFLKVHIMLVRAPNATNDMLQGKLPAIIDAYQPFLRELRPEDLAGSAAVFRIKEELLVRATQVAGAGVVKEVLIQDLVQQ